MNGKFVHIITEYLWNKMRKHLNIFILQFIIMITKATHFVFEIYLYLFLFLLN